MSLEQDKVRSLLVDTITLLCRNGLTFANDVKVQGLLAITVDSKEFFVVQIDETLAENLDDKPVDCVEPDQFDHSIQTMPSLMRNPETQNRGRLPGRKRARFVADEMNVSQSFCAQSPQKDLLATGDYSDRFVNRLSSSTQVKLEDDDLLLVDSSGVSVANQDYDYKNPGGDLRPNIKDFGEGLMMTGATAGPSRRGQGKVRQGRKRAVQWSSFEGGVEWTGQGDGSSVAADYGLDEIEEKHQPDTQQDMTHLTSAVTDSVVVDWGAVMSPPPPPLDASAAAHRWGGPCPSTDPTAAPGGTTTTVGGGGDGCLQDGRRQLVVVCSRRSMSSMPSVFKPFGCRFPGCQKRFCHETHTRRHERETHNYYRQRQKLHLQPSSILNAPAAGPRFLSSQPPNNGPKRQHHLRRHHQRHSTEVPLQSLDDGGGRPLAELPSSSSSSSSNLLLHVLTDDSNHQSTTL